MRVVFMGTPSFAVPSVRALTTEHDVVGVFTRADAVRGRGRALVPSAVKAEAVALDIPVFEPGTLRDDAVVSSLRDLEPDVIAVAAYGLILPKAVLDAAPLGVLNVHASLLPRWRGAAPIARAILAGDEVTGVSIMRMEEGLDTGPFAMVVQVPVEAVGLAELTTVLAEAGADALLATLRAMEADTVRWTAQDEDLVTYASKVDAKELALAPELTAIDAWRRVRASSDSAPSVARIAGARVRVLEASPVGGQAAGPADAAVSATVPARGEVQVSRSGLVLGLSDGALRLERIVPEGKRAMDGDAWARGARLAADATWGPA